MAQSRISRVLRGAAERERVAAILSQEQFGSRRAFGRRICREFSFFDAAGRLQVSGCLKALSTLAGEDPGIVLPPPAAAAASDRAVWNTLIAREHPRGLATFAGCQVRYLFGSEHGWLGRVLRRLPRDFEARYGFRPWLVESFVDPGYDGSCLRAVGFLRVGETAGRGRQDGGGVPVLQRPGDCERAFESGGRIGGDGAAQDLADLLDHLRGKLGDVGEGALLDLSAFPVGLADQDRGRRFAVRDDINEHVHMTVAMNSYIQYIIA